MSTQNRKHSGPPETGRVREESTSCQAHLSLPGHKGPVVAAGEHAKDEHVLLSVTNPLVIISGWLFRLVKWCRCLDVPVVPNVKTRTKLEENSAAGDQDNKDCASAGSFQRR